MLNEFLWPELEDMDVNDVYFQQDGTTCHTGSETIGVLRENFSGRVISQNGDYKLAAKIMRFNTSRLFSLGLCER